MVETGLIAPDAGVDFVLFTINSLLYEVLICKKRPRHADHIGTTVCQDLFGYARHVDTISRHQWDINLTHHSLSDPSESCSRHHRSDCRDTSLVPTNSGIEDRSTCRFYFFGEMDYFLPGATIIYKVEHRQSIDNDKVRSYSLTSSPNDLNR